jgi:hypothetical protein
MSTFRSDASEWNGTVAESDSSCGRALPSPTPAPTTGSLPSPTASVKSVDRSATTSTSRRITATVTRVRCWCSCTASSRAGTGPRRSSRGCWQTGDRSLVDRNQSLSRPARYGIGVCFRGMRQSRAAGTESNWPGRCITQRRTDAHRHRHTGPADRAISQCSSHERPDRSSCQRASDRHGRAFYRHMAGRHGRDDWDDGRVDQQGRTG